MQRIITAGYDWPHFINTDVRKWARSYLQCQRAQVQRYIVTPLSLLLTLCMFQQSPHRYSWSII